MTPELARKLLEGTTLGPWEVEMHHESRRPDIATFWIAGRTGDQVAEQETLGRHFDVTESDFYLMAAAPDMAAMIAGMRAEYAVQVRRSGGWQYSRDEDDFRWQDLSVQMVRADRDHPHEETRLVRRYVTAPQPVGEEQ